jgi:alpha-ribazole phosphatase
LILIRHGETQWNKEELFRGRSDIPLNDIGVRQAGLLAGYLADTKIQAIYSSPLLRALKTAQVIASRHSLEVKTEPGLIDMSFGEWEGKTLASVRAEYPVLFEKWAEHPERAKIPGGETLDDMRQRALQVVENVVRQYSGTVLLVSHRAVLKELICALLGLDSSHFWNIRLDTCGLTTFSYEDGRFVLTEHNNTCFLRGMDGKKRRDF